MRLMLRAKAWVLNKYKFMIYSHRFHSVGAGLQVDGKLKIHGPGKIVAGRNLYFKSVTGVTELYAGQDASITIGDHVAINEGSIISAQTLIEIGAESIIGGAIIYDTDWHGIDGEKNKTAPVHIGKHVWIGMHAIILKGVTIGDNAIIGAGSVVTSNVEANTLVAGNPAKAIRKTTGYTRDL
jgi:acetyltransferase-like isoleucine patch superfamily enzyme